MKFKEDVDLKMMLAMKHRDKLLRRMHRRAVARLFLILASACLLVYALFHFILTLFN
jgi:hypothetical protein